ncbi:DegT/DnrJ/EryC1/StrS family aminotransferase [Leisingera sp. SS27]|uniref:DegT/DnrJ/EryC1/StrS family aminotransferase n=1 Tax=Leisingera sp. SS27 TaxID=2979462 RepID=UPI002FEE4ECC
MRPLYVTQPLLPERRDFDRMLDEIWDSKMLTNNGPMHQKLEAEMEAYLQAPTAMLFNNGTIALLTALKMLDLEPGSEVITTPLTFAATAHAIVWNGLKPVFADVSPDTLTLDPASVAHAITSKTSAIIGVHVYGTICDVEGLQQVADEHGLPIIYDAAHAFGATVDGTPVASFGRASVFSFHATKLFNTFEGGLIATPNAEDRERIYFLRNFGILNEEEVVEVGINGKVNELQAAVGLLNLPLVENERIQRRRLREMYCEALGDLPGVRLPVVQDRVENSEQYFPVVINPHRFGRTRDDIYNALNEKQIFARKYFHPICTDFEPYRHMPIISHRNRPFAEEVKSQVLCLPFHSGVEDTDFADINAVFHAK